MCNGIIYNTGIVTSVYKSKNSIEIVLKTKSQFNKNEVGSSICCNGVCLTLTKIKKEFSSFYLSKETLKKTNLKFSSLLSIYARKNFIYTVKLIKSYKFYRNLIYHKIGATVQ